MDLNFLQQICNSLFKKNNPPFRKIFPFVCTKITPIWRTVAYKFWDLLLFASLKLKISGLPCNKLVKESIQIILLFFYLINKIKISWLNSLPHSHDYKRNCGFPVECVRPQSWPPGIMMFAVSLHIYIYSIFIRTMVIFAVNTQPLYNTHFKWQSENTFWSYLSTQRVKR